jgi:hypothetical protein
MLANNSIGNLGRLGNQMFQYAALRGLAAKHNYDYCLPPEDFIATQDPNCANSDCTIFDCFLLPEAPRQLLSGPILEEASFEFDNNLWNSCPDKVSLYGYFQSEKYFKHITEDIRNSFRFKETPEISYASSFFNEEFNNSSVISLHIRRGDYLKYTHHPTLPMSYYENALSQLPDVPVFVFSDDVNWCKQEVSFRSDRFYISESNSVAIDLYLQSRCSHHIIANSSFSWWGAWLAKSKKVIAPKQWFGPPLTHNTKDLYCEDWIQC